ncbi:MAG: LLM class F420-dependent oxidoreductase [Dehalococcoidia bacterium]
MTTYRLELAVSGRDLPRQAELIAHAEGRGLTGVWMSEVNGADAITQAASAATATRSMRVGTAIIPTQTRDPLLMAMTAQALSELSGGRFVLGLGTSTSVIVHDWHGRDWGKPLAGTREYVSLLRRLLAGERVSAEGPFPMKRASLARRGQYAVPIYLAALNDGMLRLAAEIADGVILNFVSTRQVKRAVDLIRTFRTARNLAEPFEIAVFFRATVTNDIAVVLPRYQQEMLTYLMSPVYQKFFSADGWANLCESTQRLWVDGERERALAEIPAAFIQERALVGTAATIKHQLDLYAEAGMDTAFILPVPVPGEEYFAASAAILDSLAN